MARVSTLAVPRLDMKPPRRADAEPAAFGSLQQHDADQGEHQHQVNDDNDLLHQAFNPLKRTGRGDPRPDAMPVI